jgi:aryl-alcohol dehydrogenase
VLSGPDIDDALRAIEPHGFRFSFVTADHPSAYHAAVACLDVEGTCGFVAPPHGPWTPDIGYLLARPRPSPHRVNRS